LFDLIIHFCILLHEKRWIMTVNVVQLDRQWIDENPNKKSEGTWMNRVIDYMRKGKGAKRVLKVVQKISRFLGEVGVESSALKNLDSSIGVTGSVLGLTRLPAAIRNAYQALAALREKNDGISMVRKGVEAVRDTMDAVSSVGDAAAFLSGNPIVSTVAQVTGLTSDVADLQITIGDCQKAVALEKTAQGEVKKALTHSKVYYMLRVAQCVAGIALAVFGLAVLVTGVALVPALAWIGLTMAVLVGSIAIDFFKNKGPTKIIKFDKQVTLA
jgi:hypothetical protein